MVLLLSALAIPVLGGDYYPLVMESFQYPLLGKQARIIGDVEVELHLATDGRVAEVKGLSGHPVLAQAAVEGVRSWRFAALKTSDTETRGVFPMRFQFRLDTPGDRLGHTKMRYEFPGVVTMSTVSPQFQPSGSAGSSPGNESGGDEGSE